MPRPPTYKRKAGEWLDSILARNYSRATYDNYQTAVRLAWRYAEPREWPQDPKKWTVLHVRTYLDSLAGLSAGTQSQYGTGLLLFLKWAGNQDLRDFRLRIHPRRSRVDWLTVEETANLIVSTDYPPLLAMMVVFSYTGIRREELSTLRMADVHPDRIRVHGKGRRSRVVPLTPQFWAAVQPYMKWRQKQPARPEFLLHPAHAGHPFGPYSPSSITGAITNHGQTVGRHLSPHTFRRSFGRHLYQQGMPVPDIQALYGHASPEDTVSYLGINDELLALSLERYQPRYRA